MKLTKRQLKKIIKEELQHVLKEQYTSVLDYPESAAVEPRVPFTRTLDDYLERMMFPQAGQMVAPGQTWTDEFGVAHAMPAEYTAAGAVPGVPGLDAAALATLYGMDPAERGGLLMQNPEVGRDPPYTSAREGDFDPTLDQIMSMDDELQRIYSLRRPGPTYVPEE